MFSNLNIGIKTGLKSPVNIKFQNKVFNSETYTPPTNINLKDVKVEVVFMDSAKKFINLPDLKFTNKKADVGEEDPKTLLNLDKLREDQNFLKYNSLPITISSNEQGNRIKGILYNFLEKDFVDQHEFCFRKSAIEDDFDVTNIHNERFRVICLYRIKPSTHKKERRKHYLEIAILDPYHLFIPSKLKVKEESSNKVITLDRDAAMNRVYNSVKDYNKDFDI